MRVSIWALNLKGAQFNETFLNMDIRDHQKALAAFRRARSEFSSDPQIRVYVDQTIPVLEAHFEDGAKPPPRRKSAGKPGERG
jgi:predicted outer membrane protein